MSDDLRARFLIVDDHQSIRKLCMTVGGSLGFHCMEAESGESALAYLETDSPDIILADLPYSDASGSKVRPGLVVQNDANNRRLEDVIISAARPFVHDRE